MFGQLLPNKNKIATVWRDTYYAKFGSKFWNLNMAPNSPQIPLCKKKIPHHIKMSAHIWSTKYRWNQKLIAQFCSTLGDEYFKPN
jgi:hypothetical protein